MADHVKEQLEHMLQLIEADPHRVWNDEFLRDLLGPELFGKLTAARDWWLDEHREHIEEQIAETKEPSIVYHYRWAMEAFHREHENRIQAARSHTKKLAELQRRIQVNERFLRDEPLRIWRLYDKLTPADKRWLTPEPELRDATNQPEVYDRAPWAVMFPNVPSPVNIQLKLALEALLGR